MTQKALSKIIVKPYGGDIYNNSTTVGGKELILNSSIGVHDSEYVNRIGVVVTTSLEDDLDLKEGDLVAVSHNIFRSFMDMQGDIQTGKVLEDETYFCDRSLVYAVNKGDGWHSIDNWIVYEPDTVEDILEGTMPDEQKGTVVFSNDVGLDIGTTIWHRVGSYAGIDLDGPKRRTTVNSILLYGEED